MPTLQDSASAYSGPSVSTLTASGITPAGSNRFGLVKVAYFAAATISSVTWGGTNITSNAIKTAVHDGANRKTHAWFYILDPPASAADVVVTTSAASFDFFIIVEAWSDVDQSTPYGSLTFTADGTGQTAVPAALNVSSATGEVVTDCYYQWQCTSPPATLDVGAGQTSIVELEGSSSNGAAMASSYRAGAASVDMGWTNEAGSQWIMYAISIKPAGGGPTFQPAWARNANVLIQ
jgi:hypothetical protein